jgi:hypothetical protein
MADDTIVAIAMLNEKQLTWLGSSLKRVYRVDDSRRFDHLIAALDEIETEQQRGFGDDSRTSILKF